MNELDDEFISRLEDRYTASEICEILDLNARDLFEFFGDRIFESPDIREELGFTFDEDLDES